jgi:hypothetical protein
VSGPPFESSTPIVIACAAAAGIAGFVWTRVQTKLWLAVAAVAVVAGVAALLADRFAVTDREFLEALFPRLAAAAERQEIDTVLAAIDPDIRPVREEARRVLAQVKPKEVRITRLKVSVDRAKQPPEAVADLIVRVTGNLLEPAGGQGTGLAEVRVLLHKKNGEWLVRDAEADQARPGQP